jgi:regulator of sigma E protease
MMGFLIAFWDYVVVFLLVLTVVVFVHEMGHFLIARWNGVRVDVFSIGFGPEIFGWNARSGTRWRIALLPIGGYVKMFGDADPASVPDMEREFTAEERAVAFHFKSVAQRAAVVVAGPLANFLFAVVALAVLLLVYGEQRTAPVVGQVQADSAAAEAGLQAGDRVVEANGRSVERFQDLKQIVMMTVGNPVALVVIRGGERLELTAVPHLREMPDIFGNVHKVPVLGVVADAAATENVSLGPVAAGREAVRDIVEMVDDTLVGLGQMIVGRRSADELGGPLGIAKGAGQAAKAGLAGVAYFVVLLSVNLGLINLFPVPLLDGGRLMFYGVEALMRKPLGARAQEYGFRVGLFLIFALMLFVTGNDLGIWKYLKGLIS